MGEEAKQEQGQEETKAQEMGEEKNEEPKAPSPFVLYVDLHCVGCAKKIEKSIMKIRGVEGVMIDMGQNQVTIKGVVEPMAVCSKIMKKTKRRAKVLSPLPATEGEPIPQLVNSQVSGLTTVELNVNMHCEACALQLKKKILKMRGVRNATTELSSGKVTVTGTMDGNKLVDYVYRRTKKQAKIVPQPEPEKQDPPEPTPEENNNNPPPQEEPKPEEDKKEEQPSPDQNNDGGGGQPPPPPPEEDKKEGGAETTDGSNDNNSPSGTEEKDGGGGGGGEAVVVENNNNSYVTSYEEQGMQRMMYHYHPLYVIERIPPAPQLFSDENPNACCIS